VSGLASCLRAVGNVSVYREVEQAQGGGDGRSTNASVLWEEYDTEFAAALSNRTEDDGSLQGVPGLIDVFSCTVTPLRNATTAVPEGSGRINGTNYTASDDPQPDSSQQDRSAAAPSGISAFAGVGIALAVMVVLLVAVLLLVRHRRLRHQHRPFAAVKDGGDNSSTGYDSTDDYGSVPALAGGLKILGPARDDRREEEAVSPDPPNSEDGGDGEDGDEEITSGKDATGVESDHEPPTVEKRLIDHEDNPDDGPSDDDTRDVEIIPVFRLLTALEINPTEDEQSLMSIVREKRNYE
jgi:hypothetical protein